MEEIKERFEKFVDRDEYKGHVHRDATAEEMLTFIQSEINLAVSKERERLLEGLDKVQKYTGGSSVEPKDIRVKLVDVTNLINTK